MSEALDPSYGDVCLVTKSRRAARAVTRRYGKLLAPHGLKPSQVSLMAVLRHNRNQSISGLAERLGIERSALTRNIKTLERMGMVQSKVQGQGRAQAYQLTAAGLAKTNELWPLWHQAQDAVRAEIGDDKWNQVQEALKTLAEIS